MPAAEEDETEAGEYAADEELEEWMAVACHLPNQAIERVELGRRDMDLAHDWDVEGQLYGDPAVFATYLAACKDQHEPERVSLDAPTVQLSAEQQSVMDILMLQLPPIASTALYGIPSENASERVLRGRQAFSEFQHAVVLSQSKRQSDPSLQNALDEIGRGHCSAQSYALLQQRFSSVVPPGEQRQFRDALHIYSTKAGAREYNIERLVDLGSPMARIPAVHNNDTARAATADQACGLDAVIYLSVGARVTLRANLWTRDGLGKGALGTVRAIVYASGRYRPAARGPQEPSARDVAPQPSSSRHSDDLPLAVLVEFDRYSGPTICGAFPVIPVTRSWKVKELACTREQIPLRLAWGTTVHSAQGLTCDRVVVNIGRREFQAGLSYVALSRCKSWDTLLIGPPFIQSRLSTLLCAPSLKRKVAAIGKIHTIARRTQAELRSLGASRPHLPPRPSGPTPPTSPLPLPQPAPQPRGRPGRPPRPTRQPPTLNPPSNRPSRLLPPSPVPPAPRPLPPAPNDLQVQQEVGVHVGGGTVTVATMPGNGHCLFASLVHQLYGTPPTSPDFEQQVFTLRRRVVQHIREQLNGDESEHWTMVLENILLDLTNRFPEHEEVDGHLQAVPLATRIQRFLTALESTAEWGAGETLRAVAEMENVTIRVHYEAGGEPLIFGQIAV
ncbi:hypothetical protein FOCC_FOCC011009 [Frankliniella occidentalis]|nr:hypothetical protein FOCC_FOCC011009 [Frankliniella occidentalis]